MEPRISVAARKAGTLAEHLANLSRGKWRGIVRFLFRWHANKWKSLRRQLTLAIGSTYAKKVVYSYRVKSAVSVANWNYVGAPYDGKLVLIRSRTSNWDRLDWSKVSSDIETIDLPIEHGTIYLEPDVQLVSETLSKLIDEAQVNRANSANNSFDSKSSS